MEVDLKVVELWGCGAGGEGGQGRGWWGGGTDVGWGMWWKAVGAGRGSFCGAGEIGGLLWYGCGREL